MRAKNNILRHKQKHQKIMIYLEYLSGYFYDKISGALDNYKQSEIKI